jgi:LuxR family transcriptional regulator
MSIPSAIQFLKNMDEQKELDEIINDFESLLIHSNFEYYAIFGKTEAGDHLPKQALAGHLPEGWSENYAKKKYAAVDPVLRFLGVATNGFRWSETLTVFKNDPNYRKMGRIITDAKQHGMEDGYTFPVHGRGGLVGFLSIAGKEKALSMTEIALMDAVAKRFLSKLQKVMGIVPMGAEANLAEGVAITRRELETLKYIAEGMTSNEISKLMDISSHTVDWYMNGLQEKLNARNRQHTVAIAFRNGLIS